MRKTILGLIMAVALGTVLVGCGNKDVKTTYEVNRVIGEKQEKAADVSKEETSEEPENVDLLEGTYAVLIEIENYGEIFVELDADAAPITVTNFMKLVNEDYYSGLTFHRIIEGFMMQGGQSYDKPAANIKGEFAANGIDNPISHKRGAISMARANDPNSANSQFFICHQDSEFLDGQYAAFGHVVSGIEVVDKVCEEAVVVDDNGTVPPENQPVIKGIYDVTAEYRSDALGEGGFVPMNEFEASLGRDSFESYDEIISLLSEGMAYAYVDVYGADEPVLLVCTTSTYDYGDGKMAAMDATPYLKLSDGTVTSGSLLSSHGTAYPISVLDGIIYCGSNHSMEGLCITGDQEEPGIMDKFYLYEEFDSDGNVTYGGFVRKDNSVINPGEDVASDDGKPLADSYDDFNKATLVEFTVVE